MHTIFGKFLAFSSNHYYLSLERFRGGNQKLVIIIRRRCIQVVFCFNSQNHREAPGNASWPQL